MVGKGGFEPLPSCSQGKRDNQATLLPNMVEALGSAPRSHPYKGCALLFRHASIKQYIIHFYHTNQRNFFHI